MSSQKILVNKDCQIMFKFYVLIHLEDIYLFSFFFIIILLVAWNMCKYKSKRLLFALKIPARKKSI